MDLPLKFTSKSTKPKLYLALILSDSHVWAALWKTGPEGIEILIQSQLYEYGSDLDNLVVKTDKALQELGKESENVDEVVFGLPLTWIDKEELSVAKKPFLKKITDDLNLKALGFVVMTEALSKELTKEEPRLSALLIELGEHELYLSLIENGKLLSTKFVGRSDNIMADMAEALARLNAHLEKEIQFPAKMMLSAIDLPAEELAKQQQLLLNHDWVNSHPFSQPPTIQVVKPEIILSGVIRNGGGAMIGEETDSKNIHDNLAVIPPNNSTQSIAKTRASSYGIPINPEKLSTTQSESGLEKQTDEFINSDKSADKKVTHQKKQSGFSMKIRTWFKQHRHFAVGGFVSGLLALGVIAFIWLKTGITAVISLDLETKSISQETTIILDSLRPTDVDNLVLAAYSIEKQVSGKQTTETTGVKVVGDKAQGKIKVFNKTDSSKTFEAGVLVSKGSLTFALDEEVTVASASTKETSGGSQTEYGQKEVSVTATQIGSDSNLTAETELQVASFDSGTYSAIVQEAFSGGSSREVRVVAQEDQAALLSDLKEKLLAQAKEEMQPDLLEDEYLAAAQIDQIDQENFDAEVGDEIGTVNLDLQLTVSALAYKTKDLYPLAEKVLADQVPEGYTLAESEPQILSAPDDKEASASGQVSLSVNVSSQVRPIIDEVALKDQIKGKKLTDAQVIIENQERIKGAEIQLLPSLVMKFYHRLPTDPAKIEIE